MAVSQLDVVAFLRADLGSRSEAEERLRVAPAVAQVVAPEDSRQGPVEGPQAAACAATDRPRQVTWSP